MKARDAQDGQVYSLPALGQRPAYSEAVCSGWNYTHEWILFVVNDERGKRRMAMVMPTQEITQFNRLSKG